MYSYDVILIFAESFMLLFPLLDYLWRYLPWRHLISVNRCVNEQSTVVPEVLSIGEVTKQSSQTREGVLGSRF